MVIPRGEKMKRKIRFLFVWKYKREIGGMKTMNEEKVAKHSTSFHSFVFPKAKKEVLLWKSNLKLEYTYINKTSHRPIENV